MQDFFADMFSAAINWKAVEENTEALASVLLKDEEEDRTGEEIPLF